MKSAGTSTVGLWIPACAGMTWGRDGVRGSPMEAVNKRVLFIDNFDSFTYNLVDDFAKRQCRTRVYRADTGIEVLKEVTEEFDPDLLVISPGPGTPDTAGVSLEAVGWFKDKLPIFGVCLGHQTIVQHFGGKIGHAPEPMHGKPSRITHNERGIFRGVENPLQAGRYHSLMAQTLPDCLERTGEFEGIVMAVEHRQWPIFGVQFHPESILTPAGGRIIQNVLQIAVERRQKVGS
jgi:anthranilate synthase/aminodeoxychorismate synthase-like glutamine amidotransferase